MTRSEQLATLAALKPDLQQSQLFTYYQETDHTLYADLPAEVRFSNLADKLRTWHSTSHIAVSNETGAERLSSAALIVACMNDHLAETRGVVGKFKHAWQNEGETDDVLFYALRGWLPDEQASFLGFPPIDRLNLSSYASNFMWSDGSTEVLTLKAPDSSIEKHYMGDSGDTTIVRFPFTIPRHAPANYTQTTIMLLCIGDGRMCYARMADLLPPQVAAGADFSGKTFTDLEQVPGPWCAQLSGQRDATYAFILLLGTEASDDWVAAHEIGSGSASLAHALHACLAKEDEKKMKGEENIFTLWRDARTGLFMH